MKQIHSKIEILTAAELQRLHDATLEVLAGTGCHLPHRRVLDRLKDAWAGESKIVVPEATEEPVLPQEFMEQHQSQHKIEQYQKK